MAAGNQQKHLEFTFSIKALSFPSRALFLILEIVKLLKIKRRDFHSTRQRSGPMLVSRTVKTRKFKLLYFRNETCFGAGNLYKDFFFHLSLA